MTRRPSRRRFLRATGAGVAVGLAGCANWSEAGEDDPVERHRERLSPYTDVARALEDGYTMTTPYVRTEEGVLGIPFVNLDVPELDPERPTVLFYDVRDDGTFALLGAEWLVPTESTDSPPSMFGEEFHAPAPGETAFVPEHYGLHAWPFDENPDGLYATYHAGATPPSFVDDLEVVWDAFTPFYTNQTAVEEAGYTNTEQCVSTPDGGYGIPFVNTDNAGTDLREPAVLLYRFSSSWAYRLMGAEWYVPAADADSPPTLFGEEFHEPMDGHGDASDQPRHYGLHAWLFTANPGGLFAPFNPTIQC